MLYTFSELHDSVFFVVCICVLAIQQNCHLPCFVSLSLSVYACVCINYATFWLTSDTVYNVKCVHVCVCNGLHLYFVRIQNAFFISVAVFFLRCSCHRINSNGGMVRCGGDGKNKREKCSFTIRTRAPYSLYMLNWRYAISVDNSITNATGWGFCRCHRLCVVYNCLIQNGRMNGPWSAFFVCSMRGRESERKRGKNGYTQLSTSSNITMANRK